MSCDEHIEDMIPKVCVMKKAYCMNMPLKQTSSNIAVRIVNTTIVVSLKYVLRPLVVRGKGKRSFLRRVSMIE